MALLTMAPLQVLDDGRATDGQGRTVNFKNTIDILTSNTGAEAVIEAEGDPTSVDEVRWRVLKLHPLTLRLHPLTPPLAPLLHSLIPPTTAPLARHFTPLPHHYTPLTLEVHYTPLPLRCGCVCSTRCVPSTARSSSTDSTRWQHS